MFELFIPPKAIKHIESRVDKKYGLGFYKTIKSLRKDKIRDGNK